MGAGRIHPRSEFRAASPLGRQMSAPGLTPLASAERITTNTAL